MNLEFEWTLLAAPLAAGLLVLSTHVLLGREVLRRGIIFIDLTIAQVAALGVILEEMLHHGHGEIHGQLAAVAAALAAAGLLAWTERRWPQLQEALIGSLYVVAASVAVLVLADHPHGHEELTRLLAGQILWITWPTLMPVALLYAGLLALWLLGARRRPLLFYPLFAVAVTASVQLVGVYLVFASLILPALAAQGLSGKRGLLLGFGVGGLGYLLGLVLSVPLDLPSGPLIVTMLAGLALAIAAVRARPGR